MSRLQKLKELQMHLENARRLLDELTMEAVAEQAKMEEEEERKKKEEAKEMKRAILPHLFMRENCRVIPMVRTPPQSPQPVHQPQSLPQPQQQQLHPRLRSRGRREETFTIPSTEDWDSEATHSPSALPITRINWENDWSRRCVCGARPGRCQH